MEVLRAKTLGFCMGVRRAVAAALAEAEAFASGGAAGPVRTLGALIHNPGALAALAARGVLSFPQDGDFSALAGATVIVRAHGVPPDVYDRLEDAGARIVDATCPRVARSQRRAAEFHRRGVHLILAGEANHAEIVGIAARAPGCEVVADAAAAAEAARRILGAAGPDARVALMAQTTIMRAEYDAMARAVLKLFPQVEVVDSICPATDERQAATAALAGEVDGIVVVGGRNSANTRRLLATASDSGVPAWMVESASELPDEVFALRKVGVAAGASTPEASIREVEDALLSGRPTGAYGTNP